MSNELMILVGSAASIGFFHTLFGPDHYFPFVMMSRARKWSIMKTSLITFICGIGHILSSVFLGFIGISLGIAVFKLEAIESVRGSFAAWLLMVFGFTYLVWGIHRIIKNKSHSHRHFHDSEVHTHNHSHQNEHLHVHQDRKKYITPWVLFTIFVFGPCEPLIPLLMYPAAKGSFGSVILVTSVFGIVTIMTMLGMVLIPAFGLMKLPFGKLEKYSHVIAGLIIFLCGGAIKFLGL